MPEESHGRAARHESRASSLAECDLDRALDSCVDTGLSQDRWMAMSAMRLEGGLAMTLDPGIMEKLIQQAMAAEDLDDRLTPEQQQRLQTLVMAEMLQTLRAILQHLREASDDRH
jgi:hypothetical protein